MPPYTVKESTEQEVKLRPPTGFRLPEQLVNHPLPKRIFTSTYYDTKDFDLARLGITLRRRVEQGQGTWQLKFPKDHARKELEISHGPTKLPVEFSDLLFAFFRGQDPLPVAKLRTERYPHQISEQEHIVAEVTWDYVAVLKDRRISKRLHELEVELIEGTQKNLKQITKQLKVAGAENGNSRPKMCQALDLEYPEPQKTIEGSAPTGEQVKLMLQQQVNEILRHDPGTRFGRDSEDLHQMRVATRRFRAILRSARQLFDPVWISTLRSEMSWLAATLGTVRDFDVLLRNLRRETQTLLEAERKIFDELLSRLESQRSLARAAMLEALRSERYLALLDQLISCTQHMDVIHPHIAIQDLAKKEFDKLEKAVDNLPKEYNDEDLHRLRIRSKRVRYAAELAEPSIGKPARRFIRQVRKLQDLLGDCQDTVIIEEHLQNYLRSSRRVKAAFTTGLIVERLRQRRAQVRRAFPSRWAKLKKRTPAVWG